MSICRFTGLLVAGLAVALAALGGPAASAAGPLKIAVVGPMTGNYAQYGEYLRRSAELAAKDINARGGAGGSPVEIVVEDDQMDARQAATVAQRLASRGDIFAVVGHFSSTTSLAAQPIYDRAGIVMISPSSTSPALSGKRNFFRTAVTDDHVSTQLAEFAVRTLGARRIAVLYQTGTSTIAQAEIFSKQAKALGADIVLYEGHEPERIDFLAVMTKLASLKPDLIFAPTFTVEAAKIARQAREAGIGAPIMGTDALYDTQLLKLAGEAAQGTYAASFFHHDVERPAAKAYVDAYRKAFGGYPEGYGANSYDAVGILAWAAEQVGNDRSKVRAVLETLGNGKPKYRGVTGDIGFNKEHNVVKDIFVVRARGDGFELVSR